MHIRYLRNMPASFVSMGLVNPSDSQRSKILKAVGVFAELIINEAARIFLDGGILITSAPPNCIRNEMFFIISPVQTITIISKRLTEQ